MKRNILIVVVIIALVIVIGIFLINGESEAEKISNYNKCVSNEMYKYFKTIDPMVQACSQGSAAACKVANDGVNKKKLEAQGICRVYLK